MYCERCAAHVGSRNSRPSPDRYKPDGRLLCRRCGALLPPVVADSAIRTKLAQLERFGLAGQRSIVAPSSKER